MVYHTDCQGMMAGVNEVAGARTTDQEPQNSVKYKWASPGISQADGTELCHFPLGWKGRRALKRRKQMGTLRSTRHLCCKGTQ